MPVTAFDGNGLVSKLEILRGDLVDVLYQATKDTVEYRFNTRISELQQDDDGVDVTLADGTRLRADLVVGADGPHSAVRGMVFGPEDQFVTPLGGYNAWFTRTRPRRSGRLVPDVPGARRSERVDATHPTIPQWPRRDWLLRPSRSTTTDTTSTSNASCSSTDSPVRDGSATRCLTAAQEADDFYFDSFLRCTCRRGTSGRVTLVGDAGYCASPLSGMGTSLALVGAYLLAGELGPADSFDAEQIQSVHCSATRP